MIDLDQTRRSLGEMVDAAAIDQIAELIGAFETAKVKAQVRLMPAAPTAALPKLVDAKEMAQILGVTENWVGDKGRAGALPRIRLGHYVKFNPPEVIEAVRKMRAAHNEQLCGVKKRKENRGGRRRVSTDCPDSSAEDRR